MLLPFPISNVNVIFVWKELSVNNMLSMYSDLAKQYVLSTNLFHSFTLLLKFGITDVSRRADSSLFLVLDQHISSNPDIIKLTPTLSIFIKIF